MPEYSSCTKTAFQFGQQTVSDSASAMSDSFKTLFTDAVSGQLKSFKDYFTAFSNSLTKVWTDMLAQMLANWITTGQMMKNANTLSSGELLGGILGFLGLGGGASAFTSMGQAQGTFTSEALGGYYHSGGEAGHASTFGSFPASLFASAPRLHKGLASDEYPAILQEGEEVTPKGKKKKQVTSSSSSDSAPTNNYYYIQAVDAKSFAEICKTNPAAISGPIMQQLRDNKIRTEFKGLLR